MNLQLFLLILINLNKDLSSDIEQELSNYSNNNIKDYMQKLKYLFELINPESALFNIDLVNKINSKN